MVNLSGLGVVEWIAEGDHLDHVTKTVFAGHGPRRYRVKCFGIGSVQFAATKSEEHSGDWSRDGKWIAFESDRTGNTDIWIQPVAGGAAIQITPDEAADFVPRWSP